MTVQPPELDDPSIVLEPLSSPVGRTPRIGPSRGSRLAFWLAVVWVGILVFVAVFADLLPLKPYDSLLKHMGPAARPRLSWTEPLGSDGLGRSMLSRLIYGARQTLTIGVVTTTVAMSLGLTIGVSAGYFRGKVDTVLNVVVDAVLSIPGIVLLLAIAAIGRRDVPTIILGLAIIGTPTYARLARASTIAVANRESVQAAKAMGARHPRIMFRELLPSVILPVSSFAFLSIAIVVVAEGSLSFLGLGVPPPTPSWGGMINDGRKFLQDAPHLVFVPAACLFLTVTSFTVLGDRARRRFDTRGSALR